MQYRLEYISRLPKHLFQRVHVPQETKAAASGVGSLWNETIVVSHVLLRFSFNLRLTSTQLLYLINARKTHMDQAQSLCFRFLSA
jgi:hypothetical protein